jgi:hypothetical protein
VLNNITNFFNLIKTGKVKTQLDASDLLAIGTRDLRFIGQYQPTMIKYSDLVAGLVGGTNGQVLFRDNNTFGGSNNLFWDKVNNRLGVGTTIPANTLDVNGTARVSNLTMPNFSTITSVNNVIDFQSFRTIYSTTFNTIGGQYGFNFDDGGGSNTNTSGTTGRFQLSSRFAPTSGTAVFNTFLLNATINQTGGANGITRGLFVDPTITAAADFRAIETTRGNVLFGTTSGNVLINTTTDAGFKLDVNGTARVTGIATFGTGTAVTRIQGNLIYLSNGDATLDSSALISYASGFKVGTIPGFVFHLVSGNNPVASILNGRGMQISDGTSSTPNASSVLDLVSTTKGFLPPRMTAAQRTAIASPAVGLMVYQTDGTEGLYIFRSTGWALNS